MSAQLGAEPTEVNEPPPEADFENVVIRIGWNGEQPAWQINDVPVESIDQLRDQLSAISEVKIDAPVILHPEQIVPLGDVIEVYDISKLAGFQKVSFAVTPGKL
jgi:biopolymer transport protein ExbD